MRHAFRFMAVMLAVCFLFNLTLAQRSNAETDPEALGKEGTRESHQGPDNPNQGNRSESGQYGSEDYEKSLERLERNLNDPQWQLDIDLHDPRSIVINYPDGTSEEYWYVMFRVINRNTRKVKDTTRPSLNNINADPSSPASALETTDNKQGSDDIEGVPVNCHLDFVLDVFTRDIKKDPWDSEYPDDPDNSVLTPDEIQQRQARMESRYKAVSDPYVLQRIAEKEDMWEWMGNYGQINEPIMLLHPLSDFQRQTGFSHDLSSPDLTGPRCFAYRSIVLRDGTMTESNRYVAVYEDNTFAGMYGQGDETPEGSHLVTDSSDEMWGKLSQRRYKVGDTVDRYGRILRANDPGYLNARIAGGRDGAGKYGVLAADNPLVGQPAKNPKVRVYEQGDHVLDNWNTEVQHADYPNATYHINGKIVSMGDARYDEASEIDDSTEMFGQQVAGRPVKMLDSRGRPIKKYLVTYRAGDVLTQAEWDIYRTRLGEGFLAKYSSTGDIVGRELTENDPVVGLPKIKMGYFVGAEEDDKSPESLKRGIDQGGRGPNGEVELIEQVYVTGRLYDPKKVDPEDFKRDPDGTFTTGRNAPAPSGAGLEASQAYIYAPLGNAAEDNVPVPSFDQYGAWRNFKDEVSGSRIPLIDSEGKLVRDMQDQIQYLKEYEYEYLYMYEYARENRTDNKFDGAFDRDQYELLTEDVKIKTKNGESAGPLLRMIYRDESEITVFDENGVESQIPYTEPKIVKAFKFTNENGEVQYLELDEYKKLAGEPTENTVSVQVVKNVSATRRAVVGVHTGEDGASANEGETIETWDDAEERAKKDGYSIGTIQVVSYVNKNSNKHFSGVELDDLGGVTGEDYDSADSSEATLDLDKSPKVWNRWTLPPPLVIVNEDGEREILTRLSDKVGPANRYDGKDTKRFLTRYISEMWGVAIFKGVRKDWDFANVYVKGLRGTFRNNGLAIDQDVKEMPNPADGGETKIQKTFLSPRYAKENWIYQTRYERLGDEYETFRDLIRRKRTFWYLEKFETVETRSK